MEVSKKRKKRRLSNNPILVILVLLLFFVNEDIFIFGTIDQAWLTTFRYVVQIGVFLCLLFLVLKTKRKYLRNTSSAFIITIAIIIVSSMVLNFDFRPGYFFMILIYLSCYLLLKLMRPREIFNIFYKAMTFLCTYSLVVWVLRFFNTPIFSMLPIIKNTWGVEYYFCGFANAIGTSDAFIRNYGPFREPGVFQIFIIISLAYGLFGKKDRSLFRVAVHILAIATTFSTTGYISLIFVLLAFFINKTRKQKKLKTILGFALVIAFAYLALGTDLLFGAGYGSVFGKIANGLNSASFSARFGSITINFQMFLSNPIFGKGITYVQNNYSPLFFERYGFESVDNTNLLMIQFARFGIVFGLFFIVRYLLFAVSLFKTNVISLLLIFIGILVLTIGEDLSYSFLMSLLLFVPDKPLVKKKKALPQKAIKYETANCC